MTVFIVAAKVTDIELERGALTSPRRDEVLKWVTKETDSYSVATVLSVTLPYEDLGFDTEAAWALDWDDDGVSICRLQVEFDDDRDAIMFKFRWSNQSNVWLNPPPTVFDAL